MLPAPAHSGAFRSLLSAAWLFLWQNPHTGRGIPLPGQLFSFLCEVFVCMPHQNLSVLFHSRFPHASSFFHRSFLIPLYVFVDLPASCFFFLCMQKGTCRPPLRGRRCQKNGMIFPSRQVPSVSQSFAWGPLAAAAVPQRTIRCRNPFSLKSSDASGSCKRSRPVFSQNPPRSQSFASG